MSEQNAKKKIRNAEKDCGFNSLCIYGGTFDPVHYGHLILAQFVKEELDVDKILFVPSFLPPHKDHTSYSDFQHRYNMLQLAIESNPDFLISNIEYKRQGTSYSYLTIDEIKQQYNLDKVYFLIGGDSLVNFHQWRNPERILDSAQVVVVGRTDSTYENVDKKIIDKVRIIDSPVIEISSTSIRQRIFDGKPVEYQIPEIIHKYIKKHNLYK